MPNCIALAGLGVDEGDDRWAEEQRVDAIKVVIVSLEDLGERPAIIGRRTARYVWANFARVTHRRRRRKHDVAAVQNRVVRPADGDHVVVATAAAVARCHAAVRCGKIKAQRVQFVQRRFDAAGDDLHRAGEARGPSHEQRQLVGAIPHFSAMSMQTASGGSLLVSRTPTHTFGFSQWPMS